MIVHSDIPKVHACYIDILEQMHKQINYCGVLAHCRLAFTADDQVDLEHLIPVIATKGIKPLPGPSPAALHPRILR